MATLVKHLTKKQSLINVLDLIKDQSENELTYIHTTPFVEEVTKLKQSGLSDSTIKEYIKCCANFDRK